jgi:hypothetical protein
VLLLFGVVFALMPSHRAGAEVAERPVLSGTVTIAASSGAVPVRLDRPVVIGSRDHLFDSTQISPADRFAGIVLYSDPPTVDGHGAFILKDGVEQAPPVARDLGAATVNSDLSVNLPAGDYKLYLLTEGDEEVSVTFRLDGAASGNTVLSPAHDIVVKSERPSNDIPVVSAAPYPYGYSAGATFELDSLGTIFQIITNNFQHVQVDRRNSCSYFQQQPHPEAALPYAPPECPSAPFLFGGNKVLASGYQTGTSSYEFPLEPGSYGFGFTRADINPLGTPFEHLVITMEF